MGRHLTVLVSTLVPWLAAPAGAQSLAPGPFLGNVLGVGDVSGDGITDYVEGPSRSSATACGRSTTG